MKIISGNIHLLEAAVDGNSYLEKILKVTVPPIWSEFGIDEMKFSLTKILSDSAEKNWWAYFVILKEENKLIGTCGYKGKPGPQGIVEIGYEIIKEYRNRGLATETAQALIDNAFTDPRVKTVMAHTLPEANASTKVLSKIGFVKIDEIYFPEDGFIWEWKYDGIANQSAKTA